MTLQLKKPLSTLHDGASFESALETGRGVQTDASGFTADSRPVAGGYGLAVKLEVAQGDHRETAEELIAAVHRVRSDSASTRVAVGLNLVEVSEGQQTAFSLAPAQLTCLTATQSERK